MTDQELRLRLIEITYAHGHKPDEILSKAEALYAWARGQPQGPLTGESSPVSTPRRGRPPKGQGENL